jgi:hypothetical protein
MEGQNMAHEKSNTELTKSNAGQSPSATSGNEIVLGGSNVLQTEGLTEDQIQELKMLHAKGVIDIDKKTQELNIDVKALDATIGTMAAQTEQISKAGDHVTMTHSHDSSLGRTEVMMGNTNKAAKGRLSKSQTGEEDNTLKYVLIIAAVVVVVVVAIISSQ